MRASSKAQRKRRNPKTSSATKKAVVDKPKIKKWYEHQHSPSVFVMFTKSLKVVWCYSGNVLRQAYLRSPDDFISGPLELPIPDDLNKCLKDILEDYDC